MDPDLLPALKALSDATRLRIAGLLAAGRRLSVEELADTLDLSPGSVVHHLRRLRDAGLVSADPGPGSVTYELRLERLAHIGGELDRMGREAADPGAQQSGPDGAALPADEARVLRAFVVDGRLTGIPAQARKREVVLRFLAQTDFRPGEELSERDVNMRLALRHPDVAALRRSLVDHGYMTRSAGIYRLRPSDLWPMSKGASGD